MKKAITCFEYPVILKKHLQYITVSVPDLGITVVEDFTEHQKVDKQFVYRLGLKIVDAWSKAEVIIAAKSKAKKPFKTPSNIKDVTKICEKPLSPQEFAKLVGVSKDTIIRSCKSGLIYASRTSGGHFKIPHGELSVFRDYLQNHIKHANEPWMKDAVSNLRNVNAE